MESIHYRKMNSKLEVPFKNQKKSDTVTFRIESELKRVLVQNNVNISEACRTYLRQVAKSVEKK